MESPADFHEPNLEKTPAERCRAYGVNLKANEKGQWWASHPHAGLLGPFESEDHAARNACVRWSL